MADARRRSLLDFAIAASVAVVPVLLAVLLVIAAASPFERDNRRDAGARHASVRQVAALKTFEHGIVRREQVRAATPDADTLLERIPECRDEWRGERGWWNRSMRLLSRPDDALSMPAQRIAMQLAELDAALLRLSAGGNRRVSDPVGFDAARWSEAVSVALRLPVESPDYPDRKFTVRCSDIAMAVATMSRSSGRMLAALAWRGSVVERAMAHWRAGQYVEISPRHVARGNPWGGIPGCVYLHGSPRDAASSIPAFFVRSTRVTNERVCKHPAVSGVAANGDPGAPPVAIAGEPGPEAAADDARWQVPPSLDAMLQPLDVLHRPSGSLYRAYTDASDVADGVPTSYRFGPNRLELDGAQVDIGFSIDLTIDPALQALAQKTAACYTGRQDLCRALGVRRAEDETRAIGQRLLERAVVRMAAIAIIDVASGRIEALAGALSPCTRQEYDGPGRASNCDKRLPYPIRYRPDALLNAAVFHDAMPASIIKPVMAASFLSNANVGPRWLAAERAAMRSGAAPAPESLRSQLMRSNSARFLDRMFCADQAFGPCERPWELQSAARAFGWNGGCASASERCGKRDLLFGRSLEAVAEVGQVQPLASWIPYGRLLAEPVGGKLGAPFHSRPPVALDVAKVRQCAAGADGRRLSGDDWEKCSGGIVVDIVAEGWGQGHARSSALGAAGMMAAVAAAANGQAEIRKPHLVRALRGVGAGDALPLESAVIRWGLAAGETNPVSHDAAEVILSGLSYSHRNGTARLACEQVFDARTCSKIDWIAGKTGTPTFPNDERSLNELARLCAPGVKRTKSEQAACGPLRPYKWYVAAYRSEREDPRWTKVIGVLTERNWIAATGRIHGAGDQGPNPAAEIAMQVAGRHVGTLAGDVR